MDGIDRRTFLKGAAIATGAAAATGAALTTASATAAAQPKPAEAPANMLGASFVAHPGSDFMVDVIKSLGIEYAAANPAASFRSLHESLVNYGGNRRPELLTALHEESSVAMAHGYAKACGKPMVVFAHGTVGLQHASMAVYNAWCDRIPVLIFAGNGVDATKRRPGVEWYHSVQDPGAMLRDFLKWDDQPGSLEHFAESTVRAYRMMMTPPQAPVLIACDIELQEHPIEGKAPPIPKLVASVPPQADAKALAEAAKLLVAANAPVIVADRAIRTQEGVNTLVHLAEGLQCPVISTGNRMNFPSTHYLSRSEDRRGLVAAADVILMLEVADPWGTLHNMGDPWKDLRRLAKPDVKVIHISLGDFLMKSNYQDMQRFLPVDLAIAGDAQTSLEPLLEAVRREIPSTRAAALGQKTDALRREHRQMKERQKAAAAHGWEASPVTTARLAAEIWQAVKDEKWSLVVSDRVTWPKRLWPTTEHFQMLGGSGGFGVGYSAPAAVGAALANRDRGILSVTIQPDGDLLYAPGVLWTAAHHKVPLLIVMFNNRGYGQEIMHLQRMAGLHRRDPRTARVGTMLWDPDIDFAKLAQAHGVWAEGPIAEPAALAPALQRAMKVVKGGAPALLDVICQLR